MDSFTFTVPPNADKKKLEALIAAQLIYEKSNEARLFFVHALALIGALLWPCLWWSTVFSQSVRAFLLSLWSVCALATLTVSIFQCVWYRRRIHRLADYKVTLREGAG